MPRLSKIGAAALAAFGWTGLSTVSASYLVVAGGGGGGSNATSGGGGGGGAGGYRTGTASLNPSLSYTVTVGAGGAGSASGSDSTFNAVTSTGGGYGGTFASVNGASGGSGGGGAYNSPTAGTGGSGNTPSTSPSQGNNGGNGNSSVGSGAGGGGASAAAANVPSGSSGTAGGAGSASSITGSSVTYAGGGGGGSDTTGASGGAGGGGAGAGGTNGNGTPGTANLGGGGGGSARNGTGGSGGSGVVIISYTAPQKFGGGIVTTSGSNVIHTFNTSGTLTPLSSLTASYLIVAGGGAGGVNQGGGGGAGGLLTGSGLTIDTNSNYVVVVGAGATQTGVNSTTANGSNSSFSGYATAAVGGGGAGGYTTAGASGGSGGGGGGANGSASSYSGGSGTSGQGYAGGTGTQAGVYTAGGGGGSSAVGANSTASVGGNGGAGTASSISGTSTYYAGGGGGGVYAPSGQTPGSGGVGGGGTGGGTTGAVAGTNGTANLGGGGGGGAGSGGLGGNGGSGVVIISYAGSTQQMAGGTVTISGGNVIHTFTSSGYLTPIKYVNNSLRFRSSASAYLSRTPSVAGSLTTWTWSGWVKRGTLSASLNIPMFSAGTSGTNDTNITFNSDIIDWFNRNSSSINGRLNTTQVFRDPAAWYHLVFVWDTTNATASNRMRIYVNGSLVTALSTATYPGSSQSSNVNNNVATYIGLQTGTSNYFDGYMTEINFIDGQALTPNSFGTFNSYGVWQPITYGGSYGTNGFYLPFTNTASATTLAYDFSPNGNNWTPNNIASTSSPATIQTFTSSTTWTAPAGVSSVNYLVVAGGGGAYIGGGGAGGYRTSTLSVTPGSTYTVTVGGGGASAANGGNSVFGSITSLGGGGGAIAGAASSGGSGGGGSYASGAGAAGTAGQGNAGGNGNVSAGGGGGGAGSTGGNAPSVQQGGTGGSGSTVSSVLGGGTYAGGGGGSCGSGTASGGSGGGGTGSYSGSGSQNGTANTGGGGGGAQTVTAGSGGSGIVIISYTVDSMTDVPTLTSATAANFCTLNPLVPDTANPAATRTFADGNLKVTTTTTAGGQSDVYGTIGVSSGKWYYEGIRTGGNVDAFFGWSSARFQVYTAYYGGNGYKYTQSGSTAYGASWTTGDVIGVAYDADNNTMTFYKNGVSQGVITSALNSAYAPYFPVTFDGSGSLYADMVFNFGQQPFVYTPPSGYVAINTYNL